MKKAILIVSFLATTQFSNAQFWSGLTPVKLNGTVNTNASEESIPVFSKDSSTLYFVRMFDANNKGGKTDQDIWMSKRSEANTYDHCERLKGFNNKFHNAIVGISEDNKTMYLLHAYAGKKDIQKGIAKSSFVDGKWTKPEEIVIDGLDIDGDFYGFHVTPDEKTMIISYEGPNSSGKEDLYVSHFKNGKWTAPMHMGSNINSAGFEISPFLSPSKDTLFFSSDGFGGEGGADIFYSIKQGEWNDWSEPINVGAPINSPAFDAYFTYSKTNAYWSSNRDSELSDIWMLTIPEQEPLPPLSITAIGTNVTKYKGTDGAIDATTEGGVAPYTYLWSNEATTEDISGVAKGDYTVKVTDAAGQVAQTTVTLTEPTPMDNIAMKHNFGYNSNMLSLDNSKLKDFAETILKQFENGRESITIVVNSSASKVRTRTFKNNKNLAQKRANNITQVLTSYFEEKGLGNKVKVEINDVLVQGPDYEGDYQNREKYEPFQFIELKTK